MFAIDMSPRWGFTPTFPAQPEHRERMDSMRGQIAEMVCHTGPGPYDWCLSEGDKMAAAQ